MKSEHTIIHSAPTPTRIRTAFNFWAHCIWKCISTSYLLHSSDCPMPNLPAMASPSWLLLPYTAENWLGSCGLWISYQLVPNKTQASSYVFFLSPAFLWTILLHLSAASVLRNIITNHSVFQHNAPQGAPSIPSLQTAIPRETFAIWNHFWGNWNISCTRE